MSEETAIALFPLNTVLFPDGPLPLRIFEPRYVDMVRDCMRTSSVFGVVLAEGQSDVTPDVTIATVGTCARIIDFTTLPDGLLGILCLGERKFEVIERTRQADGLNLGKVLLRATEPAVKVAEAHRHLAELLQKILARIGGPYERMTPRLEDASWVGCRLAEILPLPMPQKQSLLELDDPHARLESLSLTIQRTRN
jgi:uncharacterized protein